MRHPASKLLAAAFVLSSLFGAHAALADEPVVLGGAPSASVSPCPPPAPPPEVRIIVVETRARTQAPPPSARPTSWYGYQTMAVDLAALAMAGLSIRAASPELAIGSLATYALATPLVHVFHGNGLAFGADVGLRLGAPVAGALVGAGLGALADERQSVYGPVVGALFGAGVGGVTAMVVDYALLAKEPAKEEPWDGKIHATPTVAASPSGASVGVGGSF